MNDAQTTEVLGYLGANVRRLRRAQGMTQEMLASEAELDITTVSRLENGRLNATMSLLVRLAGALGLGSDVTTLVKPSKLGPKPKRGRPLGR